ncbi:transposase, partial [bacterium]|nr:transposase [bacterium]
MKDESLENTVITLHGQGWSMRRLSKELGISRERVRRLLAANSASRTTTQSEQIKPKKKLPGKLDPYKEFISELLEKYTNITGQRVYEHLKEKGFDGGTTIVSNYLHGVRRVAVKTPVRMVETLPGQRGAHDWSDYNIPFTLSGKTEQVTFLSYILGYSRRQYIEVVKDKKQKTLFQSLINAFIYLDGVPKEIKSDNQKACV